MKLQEAKSLLKQNYDFDGVIVCVDGDTADVKADTSRLRIALNQKSSDSDAEVLEFDGDIFGLAASVQINTMLGTESLICNENTIISGTIGDIYSSNIGDRFRNTRAYVIITMIALMANGIELDLSKDVRAETHGSHLILAKRK